MQRMDESPSSMMEFDLDISSRNEWGKEAYYASR